MDSQLAVLFGLFMSSELSVMNSYLFNLLILSSLKFYAIRIFDWKSAVKNENQIIYTTLLLLVDVPGFRLMSPERNKMVWVTMDFKFVGN